jgi:hypothetical protein
LVENEDEKMLDNEKNTIDNGNDWEINNNNRIVI